MIELIYLIRNKIVDFSSKFFSSHFVAAKDVVVDWVKPKIQNLPGIIILVLASIGFHSIICDCSIWVLLAEIPFIFNSAVCIPSAVSVLFIVFLVKIIEYMERIPVNNDKQDLNKIIASFQGHNAIN